MTSHNLNKMEEIKLLEQKINNCLNKEDSYLVRKYCNRQDDGIIKKVARKNLRYRGLIWSLYQKWAEVLKVQKTKPKVR